MNEGIDREWLHECEQEDQKPAEEQGPILTIMERRVKVRDYLAQGWSHARIGQELGVTAQTIWRDSKWWNAQVRTEVTGDPDQKVGYALLNLRVIEREALSVALQTQTKKERISALGLALKANEARTNLMFESGVLSRVPRSTKVSISGNETMEELMKKRAEILAEVEKTEK